MKAHFNTLYGKYMEATSGSSETNLDRVAFLMRVKLLSYRYEQEKKESRATLSCNCKRTMTRHIVSQLSLFTEKQCSCANIEEMHATTCMRKD